MPARKKTPNSDLKTALCNLEMKGDRLKVFTLQTLLTNKQNKQTRDMARLGDVLLPWFENSVGKPAAKLEGIVELWQEHVPPAIVRRSRLIGFHRSTLSVSLDSTTVRAELDTLLRSGLLRLLQRASKGALYRVKCYVQAPIREVQ